AFAASRETKPFFRAFRGPGLCRQPSFASLRLCVQNQKVSAFQLFQRSAFPFKPRIFFSQTAPDRAKSSLSF
ncbi:MAG TPA: hypothetical protein PKH32_13950, partial [Verrucomicrobiota bacterium]|nr:hypothetical protein [Verrucomicrobiota bacterium]